MDTLVAPLDSFHTFFGYVVLIAAILALLAAVAAWFGALPARQTIRRAGLLYTIPLDIQLLVGLIVWFGKGGLALPTPFRLEHPMTMILALVAAHVGQVLAKRAKTPKAAARALTIGIAVSLILVVLGIPGLVRGG